MVGADDDAVRRRGASLESRRHAATSRRKDAVDIEQQKRKHPSIVVLLGDLETLEAVGAQPPAL
jgi:hypothetical protein